jgi:hypothetical protein
MTDTDHKRAGEAGGRAAARLASPPPAYAREDVCPPPLTAA